MDNRPLYSAPHESAGIKALRDETLGQVHYGGPKTYIEHPFQLLMIKSALVLNAASWILLWLSFRIRNMIPPHDMPFMSAIGWYFIFGGIYCLFSFLFFRFARFIERRDVTAAVTHDRSYAWTRYNTQTMTEADLKKVAVDRHREQPVAVNPGGGYFRISGLLILAALFSWGLGIAAITADLF